MLGEIRPALTNWIVRIFVAAINSIRQPDDRDEALRAMAHARELLESSLPQRQKALALYREFDARRSMTVALRAVADSARRYRESELPLAAKVALPVTVLSAPVALGHSAGIAAFGTAIGVPVLLVTFIGAAGVTAILEACAASNAARQLTSAVLARIERDEAFRRLRANLKRGHQGPPGAPRQHPMPQDLDDLRCRLLDLAPTEFEEHVMSLFETPPLEAVITTKASGDQGIDGAARHPNGLIVVQCKRYASHVKVGGPEIRAFKGAMIDQGAWKGYFVTTSGFTRDAVSSALKTPNLVLVDLDVLVGWHSSPPDFREG